MSVPWLAVVDAQHIFAAPDSPWAAPGFAATVDPLGLLIAAAGEHVVFTRFVAPAEPAGAWVEYYERWAFALQPPDAPAYRLVDEVPHTGHRVVDATTFGKWQVLQPVTGEAPLVLAGVATDCCVVSTALAAADAGVPVRVVAQACAGADDASHRRALDLMAAYAPLVQVVDLDVGLALLGTPA